MNFIQTNEKTEFVLPRLPYSYHALEPFIGRDTMEIHHHLLHASYIRNLNHALAENLITFQNIEAILSNISSCPDFVRINAGAHYNHTLFFSLLKENAEPIHNYGVCNAILCAFGSINQFKLELIQAADWHQGNGWLWLHSLDGHLTIRTTPSQDNLLMDTYQTKGSPILCLDLWQHAYSLKHKDRSSYIENWWNVINWGEVDNRYWNSL